MKSSNQEDEENHSQKEVFSPRKFAVITARTLTLYILVKYSLTSVLVILGGT